MYFYIIKKNLFSQSTPFGEKKVCAVTFPILLEKIRQKCRTFSIDIVENPFLRLCPRLST